MNLTIPQAIFTVFISIYMFLSFMHNRNVKKNDKNFKEIKDYELSDKEILEIKEKTKLTIENKNENIFNIIEKILLFKEIKMIIYVLNKNRLIFRNSEGDFYFCLVKDFELSINNQKEFENNIEKINKYFNEKITIFNLFENEKKDKVIIFNDYFVYKTDGKFYILISFEKIEDNNFEYFNYGKIISNNTVKNIYNLFYKGN